MSASGTTDLSVIESFRSTQPGEFVSLRPLRTDDAAVTLGWRLSQRASLLHRGAETVDQQREWIAARPSRELNYVIETRAGSPVGMVSLIDIDLAHRRAEPSRFLIGEEEAVKGIPAAVEAMRLLYAVAFEGLGLQRVYGTVAEDNPRMITWQVYLGMKVEGRLRRHVFMNGRLQDLVCLGLLEEEYRKTTLPRMKALIAMALGAQRR